MHGSTGHKLCTHAKLGYVHLRTRLHPNILYSNRGFNRSSSVEPTWRKWPRMRGLRGEPEYEPTSAAPCVETLHFQ